MSEMVERVVKLMKDRLASEDFVYLREDGDLCVVDGHVDMVALARAAIEGMREPTEAMLHAGTPWYQDNWRPSHVREDTSMEAIWQAMIDAALAP